jgi:hypothetical protein
MFCPVCKQPKTPADFYAGVFSRCKDCHKARMKYLRLVSPRFQERDRERAKTPERRAAARVTALRWRAEHPEAYRAQTAVNNAVRDRRLTRGPCEICGTDQHVHGHHKDYSKPLEVIWLCARCHHRIHATFPELGGHFTG